MAIFCAEGGKDVPGIIGPLAASNVLQVLDKPGGAIG